MGWSSAPPTAQRYLCGKGFIPHFLAYRMTITIIKRQRPWNGRRNNPWIVSPRWCYQNTLYVLRKSHKWRRRKDKFSGADCLPNELRKLKPTGRLISQLYFAYRPTVHEATGHSPNMLMFGREVRLPVDLLFECPAVIDAAPRSTNEFVAELVDRMTDHFEAVRKSLGRAAECRKNQYDVKVKAATFAVGDQVYYWYPRRYQGRSPKLQSLCTGPYEVIRVIDSHNLVIQKSPRSKPIVVYRDKLKRVVT